jgi:hypothetical protein
MTFIYLLLKVSTVFGSNPYQIKQPRSLALRNGKEKPGREARKQTAVLNPTASLQQPTLEALDSRKIMLERKKRTANGHIHIQQPINTRLTSKINS